MKRLSMGNASLLVIKLSLGGGGSFLAAAFILEAYLMRGMMIPAAAAVFVMVALIVYLFARIGPGVFVLATLAWMALLSVTVVPVILTA